MPRAEARERKWSTILRAKHARNASILLGDSLETHVHGHTLHDITHSVRSTPLTTIPTATLWLNH